MSHRGVFVGEEEVGLKSWKIGRFEVEGKIKIISDEQNHKNTETQITGNIGTSLSRAEILD